MDHNNKPGEEYQSGRSVAFRILAVVVGTIALIAALKYLIG